MMRPIITIVSCTVTLDLRKQDVGQWYTLKVVVKGDKFVEAVTKDMRNKRGKSLTTTEFWC